MLQGVYRSFGDGEVCVRVLRLLLLAAKGDVRRCFQDNIGFSNSNYHQILRRSIDFNPDREAVCTVTKLSQRLDAPPYSQYCHQVHQVSRRCHTATANATAKVRSQESTQHATRNTQEAKSPKAAPGAKP
jgi:hypothetical protein